MSETARSIVDKYSIQILLMVCMTFGAIVWGDIKETLGRVMLIQFQQIKDGKDIEQQHHDIERLKLDVEGLKFNGSKHKSNFNSDSLSVGDP